MTIIREQLSVDLEPKKDPVPPIWAYYRPFNETCSWHSKSTKTKIYVTNYARYTMLKNHFPRFTLGHMTSVRISKENWSTITILKPWHCQNFNYKKKGNDGKV